MIGALWVKLCRENVLSIVIIWPVEKLTRVYSCCECLLLEILNLAYVNTERHYLRLIYLSGKNKNFIDGCLSAVKQLFCETEKTAVENFSLLLRVFGKTPCLELMCLAQEVFRRKGECVRQPTTWPSGDDENWWKCGNVCDSFENTLSLLLQNYSKGLEHGQRNGTANFNNY